MYLELVPMHNAGELRCNMDESAWGSSRGANRKVPDVTFASASGLSRTVALR